jgi:hypothetical protein
MEGGAGGGEGPAGPGRDVGAGGEVREPGSVSETDAAGWGLGRRDATFEQ